MTTIHEPDATFPDVTPGVTEDESSDAGTDTVTELDTDAAEVDADTDGGTDEDIEALITAGLDPDRDPFDRPPLFDEDTGTLTLEQRNAMNAAVKARFITEADNPAVWRALVAHRAIITSRLHDQFKHLHLFPDRGMGYVADVAPPTDGRKFVLLGTQRTFNREQTAILVYLRQRYSVEMAAGQQVAVVEKADILAHVEQMQPRGGNRSAATKRAVAALDHVATKFGLLPNVPDSPDTYRIHPAIEMFLGLDDVRRLDEAFRTYYAAATDDHTSNDTATGADDAEAPATDSDDEYEDGLFDE